MSSERDNRSLPAATPATHARMLDYVRENIVESELLLLRNALIDHAGAWISGDEDPRINFSQMQAEDLAGLMRASARLIVLFAQAAMYPNEALKRELGFELSSWEPVLPASRRMHLAALLLPALPEALTVSSLLWMYEQKRTESALRHMPGRWEYTVRTRLSQMSHRTVSPAPLQDIGDDGQAITVDAVVWESGPIEDLQSQEAAPALFAHIQRIGSDYENAVQVILAKSDIMKRRYGMVPIIAVLYSYDLGIHGAVTYALTQGDVDAVAFATDEAISVDDALLATLRLTSPHLIGGSKRIAPTPVLPGKVGEQGTLFKG